MVIQDGIKNIDQGIKKQIPAEAQRGFLSLILWY
jgi:hypothetical protein